VTRRITDVNLMNALSVTAPMCIRAMPGVVWNDDLSITVVPVYPRSPCRRSGVERIPLFDAPMREIALTPSYLIGG
jgi:hypothetical protein